MSKNFTRQTIFSAREKLPKPAQLLDKIEEERPAFACKVNGEEKEDFRDYNDLTMCVFEVDRQRGLRLAADGTGCQNRIFRKENSARCFLAAGKSRGQKRSDRRDVSAVAVCEFVEKRRRSGAARAARTTGAMPVKIYISAKVCGCFLQTAKPCRFWILTKLNLI